MKTVVEGAPEGLPQGSYEVEFDRIEGDTLYLRYVPTDYFLLCLVCHPPEKFENQRDRGHFAFVHTQATGHDKWRVTQQRRKGVQ